MCALFVCVLTLALVAAGHRFKEVVWAAAGLTTASKVCGFTNPSPLAWAGPDIRHHSPGNPVLLLVLKYSNTLSLTFPSSTCFRCFSPVWPKMLFSSFPFVHGVRRLLTYYWSIFMLLCKCVCLQLFLISRMQLIKATPSHIDVRSHTLYTKWLQWHVVHGFKVKSLYLI